MENAEVAYYTFPDKFLNFFTGNHGQGFGFCPFGEVVDGDHCILEYWASYWHRTDQIYSPDCEEPWQGHRSELLWMRSRNARESLAFVPLLLEVHGFDLHCWPKLSMS